MTDYPKVSIFIMCYQQSEYIVDAIYSALSQDYKNLQVVISDDASSDDTYSIICRIVNDYQGPHQIITSRNEKNVGIGLHFQKIMTELVSGELVVASAGDDVSCINRVSRIVEMWLKNGKPVFIAHNVTEIDELGKLCPNTRTIQYRHQQDPSKLAPTDRLLSYIANPYPIPFIGAAVAYTRELYTSYDIPIFPVPFEDHIMYFRSLLVGDIFYFNEELVKYRRHSNNFSSENGLDPNVLIKNVSLGLDKKLRIPSDSLNFHYLRCQQWCDYVSSIRHGIRLLDMSITRSLWRTLELNHQELTWKASSIAGRFYQLYYVVSQNFRRWILILCGRPAMNISLASKSLLSYLPSLQCVIFGASRAGEFAYYNIPAGMYVVGFLDNDKSKQGKYLCNLPILAPKQIESLKESIDFILIASLYYHEIKAQLIEEFDIPNERIVRATHAEIVNSPQDVFARPLAFFLITTILSLLFLIVVILN